ncbi:MAG: hypothetical protein PHW38_05935 [Candidatus Cloacimonetes bacterium]
MISNILMVSEVRNVGLDILGAIGPILVLILAPLISRLFKKLGLEIADSSIEPVLMRIIEIIVGVEKENKDMKGTEKKNIVVERMNTILNNKEKEMLLKRYGSLETAVEAAFQRSNIARK